MDYSKTQRIVLLIDLHRPSSLSTIFAAAKRLLSFPPLSSSLFAFKFFFSSLSPLRSSSLLNSFSLSSPSLSFNLAPQTLNSLAAAIEGISVITLNTSSPPPSPCTSIEGNSVISGPCELNTCDVVEGISVTSRGLNTCSALMEIVHDYGWELEIEIKESEFLCVRSNLVVLFSPICRSLNDLAEYMSLDLDSDCLESSDRFSMEFRRLFSGVRDAFVSRDIHFTWLDVSCEIGGDDDNRCRGEFGYFEKGIRSFDWGCCLSDAIVLGSALVPFHLIYPRIGVPLNDLDSLEKRSAQLSLEIADVNGKPLICKCCDLEVLNLRTSNDFKSVGVLDGLESRDIHEEKAGSRGRLFSCFGNEMKLQVTAVYNYDELSNHESFNSESFLVRDFSGESEKRKCKLSEEFIADKVLKVLLNEPGKNSWGNSVPIWQILLSFLQNRGYWATISISNANGDVAFATLKPFTVHWGLMSITTYDFVQDHGCSGAVQAREATNNSSSCHNLGVIGSQTDSSTPGNKEPLDGKRRKSNRLPNRDLTWSFLRSAAVDCSHFDLAEVYISKQLNRSKKLKFLKCWMKQIWKCSQANFSGVQAVKSQQEQVEYQNFPDQSQIGDELLSVPSCKSSESFFSDILSRIQHGIQSKMDLQMFAERLVKSSVYWLCQTTETDENVAERKPKMDPSCKEMVYKELRRLLLKNPKEMKEMRGHTDCFSDNLKHNSVPTNIVREYELQIFLRMEILRSEVAESIKESMKHKIVKQICSLLEILQYLLEGGIHGPINLLDYIERNIKSRYFDVLEDAVNEIYAQMDLLPFGDDDEAQIQLLDSEDSNHSWRDRQDRYDKAEISINHQSVSADDNSSQPPYNVDESFKETEEEEHARKLREARERRERSRRSVYLTSRAADLHRVWAPKQQKSTKANSETLREKSKLGRKRVTSSVVCETPLFGTKRPFAQGSMEEERDRVKTNSCPVSKALFQDEI